MSSGHTYVNAPVTEALIDIRVERRPDIMADELKSVHASLRDTYPATHEMSEGMSELKADSTTSSTMRHVGYRLSGNDMHYVLQAQLHGLTISKLAPYTKWEDLLGETRRVWDIYRSATRPLGIRRLGVRYINRLDLPLPFHDFSEYLLTYPEVGRSLPQLLGGFVMQAIIPLAEQSGVAIINQSAAPTVKPNTAAIMLDIDVYRDVALSIDGNGIWDILEELRVQKNRFFEGCITDKTRELFK
jgi:uncharacterized protein (TIGR04255 family)